MKHAILICAFKDIDYLNYFVGQFDKDFDVFIHLDKKSKFPEEKVASLKAMSNVKSVISTYKVNWGGSNLLFSIIQLMKIANDRGGYEYFHTLSGNDIAVKSCEDFKNYFKRHLGKEFIEFCSFSSEKWEISGMERLQRFHLYNEFNAKTRTGLRIIKFLLKIQKALGIKYKSFGKFPVYYGGSCWFSISKECVNYCIGYIENNPDVFRELKYTLLAEEIFFQTLILNSPFKEKVVNDNIRYIDWEFRNGNSPAILDDSDRDKLGDPNKLFARKIEPSISKGLIDWIGRRRG